MATIREVARILGVGELVVLFELRILGQPRGEEEVPAELMPILRVRLGSDDSGVSSPGEPADDDHEIPEDIRNDPNSHRRIVRRLCEKLATNHRWAPTVMLFSTIVRGFSEAERGDVRDSIEVMRKASWVLVPVHKRVRGEVGYSLNPQLRSEIMALIHRPDAAVPSVLSVWFEMS